MIADICGTTPAAGVIQADDWRAILHGVIHDFADLLGVSLGERTAKDREILREHVDQSPINLPVAGNNPVARNLLLVQAKICGAMRHKHIQFIKCARV